MSESIEQFKDKCAKTQFEVKIRKHHLYPFLYGISAIVDECKLHIKPDGIYVKEVDPANVCLVDARLPEHIFESGTYQIKKPIVVGLDILKYLHILSDDDTDNSIITLKLPEPVGEDMPKLITIIEGRNRFHEYVKYEHTTLKIESIKKSPKIPDIIKSLPLVITIPLELLKRSVEVVDYVGSDCVCIGVNFNNGPVLFVKNHGNDTDTACTKIRASRLPGFKHKYFGENTYPVGFNEIKSLFPMDCVKEIIKGFAKYGHSNIKLNLGTDLPAILSTDFGDKGPELKYTIAPRIEDD